ncbi:KTSC domain-containing protein [Sphingomonas immobilis]|uniref:KTSC domain-containing protein n=1 Tax=Sphingomonas immobilis TaxID=3063997 RepID=A0ABT8ZXP8_9SPHN|nr:KTSC domain-containing protein [Sphingomonas sp. CA1-15]MDO7841909.1 KTSC domain-containing protein [Sphingomonas sp. CA1-15]
MTRFGVDWIRLGAQGGTIDSAARCAAMRACRFPKSAMIERVCYDDAAQTMSIAFRSAIKYFYYDVPEPVFAAFCQAASAGTFFNEQIKGRFRCQRDPDRRRFGPNANLELPAR